MQNAPKIVETYELPSMGKIYRGREVKSTVDLASMTTRDELKRLNKSDVPYKNLAEVIDGCIQDELGISSYDMCIGDFQYLMHKLRTVTYGPEYKLSCNCPYCLQTSAEVVNLDQLHVKTFDEKILDCFKFTLPQSGNTVELRLQTPRMLDNVQRKVLRNKQDNNAYIGEPAFLYTITEMIKSIDGNDVDPVQIENWVYNLPMKDVNLIVNMADEINKSIGIDDMLTISCEVCGMTYRTPFRITDEFFRPSI